jgi:hypothetical protein
MPANESQDPSAALAQYIKGLSRVVSCYTDQVPGSCIPSSRGSGFEEFSCIQGSSPVEASAQRLAVIWSGQTQNEFVLVCMHAQLAG